MSTRKKGYDRMHEDYKELTKNPIKHAQNPKVKQILMAKKAKRRPRVKDHNKEKRKY